MDLGRLKALLGLTDQEATVFAAIHERSSATAQEVADLLQKPRSLAYTLLRSLASKGLVAESPGRPLTYHARPIWDALGSRQSEVEAILKDLRQATAAVERDRSRAPEAMEPGAVALFSGPVAIEREASRLVAEAPSSVLVSGFPMPGAEGGFGLLAALREALARGVDVRVYLPRHAQRTALGHAIVESLGEGRIVAYDMVELAPLAAVATDHAVLYVFGATGSGLSRLDALMGVRIRGSPLPAFTRLAIRQLLHPVVATPLGSPPPHAHAAHVQAVERAQHEVKVMAGSGWSALRTPEQREELLEAFIAAHRRGVRIKLLIDNDAAEVLFLRTFRTLNHIEEIRLGQCDPGVRTLIDDRYMAYFVGDVRTGLFHYASEDLRQVQCHLLVFERLWRTARPLPDPRMLGSHGETAAS